MDSRVVISIVLLLIACCLLGVGGGFVDNPCAHQKLFAVDGASDARLGYRIGVDAGLFIVGAQRDDAPETDSGSAYVFELGPFGWREVAKLTAGDGREADFFGSAVAVSGAFALVGATQDDDLADRSGSAYVFQRDPDGSWSEIAKLLPLDGMRNDFFGSGAAIRDGQFFVGARGHGGGAIYIFEQRGEEWLQVDKLVPKDIGSGDHFGDDAIAIDGNLLIAGAQFGFTGEDLTGEAYIFERQESGRWEEVARLENADHGDSDDFGESVAIEGNLVVVGASGHKFDPEAPGAGAAYVFERDEGGNWNQTAKLIADDYEQADNFGRSVALWGDLVLVGATSADVEGGAPDAGAIYVFRRTPEGEYEQIDEFSHESAETGNSFGERILLDRGLLMIGTWRDDDNGENAGAAYFFSLPECARACCMPGGACTLDAPARCEGLGGVPFDEGVACGDEGVDCAFACCEADGSCSDRTVDECDGVGGTGHFGETCDAFECPEACCFEDGSCVDAGPNACGEIGGTPAGPGTTCDDDPPICEPRQACCFDGGACQDVTPTNCALAGGLPGGADTDCRSWDCLEACCLPGDVCLNIEPATCLEAGEPQGLGTRCADDPCDKPCVRDPAWQCDGDVDGDGQVNPVDSGLVQAAFCTGDDCTPDSLCQYDLDCDGQINPVDSGIVQSRFGTCDPPRDVCR